MAYMLPKRKIDENNFFPFIAEKGEGYIYFFHYAFHDARDT